MNAFLGLACGVSFGLLFVPGHLVTACLLFGLVVAGSYVTH